MSLYQELRPVASELLREFATGSIYMVRSEKGDVDEQNPHIPVTSTSKTYVIHGVVRNVEQKYVDGTRILVSDRQINASAVQIHTETNGNPVATDNVVLEFRVGDVVFIDGAAHQIVNPVRVPGAGHVVSWKLIVRG